MRIYPHKKIVTGQDLQPADYLNQDLQQAFTIANGSLDSSNFDSATFINTDYDFQAWQEADHFYFDSGSLSSIAVVDTTTDFDSFGMKTAFTLSGSGIVYGSATLPYQVHSIGETNWWSSATQMVAGYIHNQLEFIIHHKFGVFIDGIKVAETDNIGQGVASGFHLNFCTPLTAGTHTLEIKVKLANGSALASSFEFVPGELGYAWLYLRKR